MQKWPDYQGAPVIFQTGVYKHYKGGLYTALGIVFHHESRQPMVLYASHEYGTLSVRSLFSHDGDPDGWTDIVDGPDGVPVSRFKIMALSVTDSPQLTTSPHRRMTSNARAKL